MASRNNRPDFNRRKMLGLIGMGGAAGIAGCLGDDDGEATPTPTETEPGGTDTPTPTPTDTQEIQEGGTLRTALSAEIASFDVPYSNDTTSAEAQSILFEGMTTTAADGTVYPWLAKSFTINDVQDPDTEEYEEWMIPQNQAIDEGQQIVHTVSLEHEEDNPLVMTTENSGDAVDAGVYGMEFEFTLREGIEFHNGDELTSEDIIATFERYEHSMVEAQTYDNVLHYRADGDYTVKVYTPFPDAEGIRNVTMTAMHRDQAALEDGAVDPREGNDPIGTGPFVFEEIEDAEFWRATKNDNYWLENKGLEVLDWFDGDEDFPAGPVIDEIDFDIIPSDATRAAAVLNDEVDLSYGLSRDVVEDFVDSPDFKVVSTSAGGYTYMQFPMKVEPWDNQNLRRGANHLIPREIIVEDVYNGLVSPAWTPLAKVARGNGTQDYDALEEMIKPRNEFDEEKAAEFFDQAEADGVEFPVEIRIETNAGNDERVSMCELIAESFEASGYFETSIELYEWGAYLNRILNTEYQHRGHMYIVGLSATFNPDSFYGATNHTRNIGQCCNANGVGWDDLDDMLDEAQFGLDVMDDPEYRAELYDDIADIVTTRAGTVYNIFPTNDVVMNDRINGWATYPFSGSYYGYGTYSVADEIVTWIDQDE